MKQASVNGTRSHLSRPCTTVYEEAYNPPPSLPPSRRNSVRSVCTRPLPARRFKDCGISCGSNLSTQSVAVCGIVVRSWAAIGTWEEYETRQGTRTVVCFALRPPAADTTSIDGPILLPFKIHFLEHPKDVSYRILFCLMSVSIILKTLMTKSSLLPMQVIPACFFLEMLLRR